MNDLALTLSPRMSEIVGYYFDNRVRTFTDLAKHFDISLARVSQIMRHPRVRAAYPVLAKRNVRSMLPRAIGKLEDLMMQTEDLSVSAKVVFKILDSEKVLEPMEVRHTHTLELKSSEELTRIVNRAREMPVNSVDAELAKEDDEASAP